MLDAAARRPLAGALVWPGDDPGNATFTDDRGIYTVAERASGRAWVRAAARGFRPQVATLPRADAATARIPTLALEPANTLAGRVVDTAGAPLGGVVVTVAPDAPRSGKRSSVSTAPRAAR